MSARRNIYAVIQVIVVASLCTCSAERPAADCKEEPGQKDKGPKIETTVLGRVAPPKSNTDWCRACVLGNKGYASCQRVYAQTAGEDREKIRARARDKACRDAGFPPENCPKKAVFSLLCRGESPPEGTKSAGDALKDIYAQPRKAAPGPATGQPAKQSE